jgi:hypothetical protein
MRSEMKGMLTLTTAGLIALCAGACGGGAKNAVPGVVPQLATASTLSTHGYIRGDQDGDVETHWYDSDDARIRGYGHPASAADGRAVTTLVKRYYAAAAAGDEATTCALTFAGLARSADFVGAAAEDYRPTPGSPQLRGGDCVAVMSVLAKERHEELVADVDTLTILGVRVLRDHALALLGFSTTGERVISLQREDGAWRVDGLFDKGIT